MNEKLNKVITIFLIFTFFLSNVFRILPIVEVVSAAASSDEVLLTDDDYFTIGSVMNASQDGQAGKTFYREAVDLGRNIIDTAMDNGIRVNRLVRKRGVELMLNPKNLFEVFKMAWKDFSDFQITQVKGKSFVINMRGSGYIDGGTEERDFYFWDFPGYPFEIPSSKLQIEFIGENMQIQYYDSKDQYAYNRLMLLTQFKDVPINFKLELGQNGGYAGTYYIDKLYDGYSLVLTQGTQIRGFGVERWNSRDSAGFENLPMNLRKVIITDDPIVTNLKRLVPYNSTPPEEEIEENYTDTFKEAVPEELKPVDPKVVIPIVNLSADDWFKFNVPEIKAHIEAGIDNTINPVYVQNNYTIITQNPEEENDEDTPITKPGDTPGSYTNVLDKILAAIKELPEKIADLMPEPIYEAGTNIWDFLTDSLGNILDFLETLLMGILNLIFPNEQQLEESKGMLNGLMDTITEKTDFITAPIQSFSSVYGASRVAMFSSRGVTTNNNSTNLYNRTMTINDTELHILPASLEPAISNFRMVSTGVVVILTIISIYTRFRGMVKN